MGLCPTSHNMSEPIVKKFEYTVMDVSDEGALSLLTAEGEPKDDLNLPTGTEDLDKIADQIKAMFADGKGIRVTTMTAIGQECVCGSRKTSRVELRWLLLVCFLEGS